MEKEVRLLDYKNEAKTFIIKDFEKVTLLVFQIISGDGVLRVVYDEDNSLTLDSNNTRLIDYHDGTWCLPPRCIDDINDMKDHYDTDRLLDKVGL